MRIVATVTSALLLAALPVLAWDEQRFPRLVDDLSRESLVVAIERSLDYYGRTPANDPLRFDGITCPTGAVMAALRAFGAAVRDGYDLEVAAAATFALRSAGPEPLVTGYYEPVLPARREPDPVFRHPVYRPPPEMGSPGPTRQEIDAGRILAGRDLEIAWLADPVDVFFLHIQGSGTLRFPDGSSRRIGFAASNGRPYTSIGRLLVGEGTLVSGKTTAPEIQRYLRAHPERHEEILFANERYVFFRTIDEGPIGSLDVPLTAGRSVAADAAHYPPGVLAYVESSFPVVDREGRLQTTRPIRRFVLLQDSGAAITGPRRLDLFFGTGEQAGLEAGNMAFAGGLYLLVPKRCL